MAGGFQHPSVGVFHPGTQHSWQTARALQRAGMLSWYITSIFYNEKALPYNVVRFLPNSIRKKVRGELMRFYHPDLPPEFVHTAGLYEWAFRGANRIGLRSLAKELNLRSNSFLARKVARQLDSREVGIIWGYDGCSQHAFRQAKHIGLKTILDKTIGDPRAYNEIMSSVFELYPEYFLDKQFLITKEEIDIRDEEYTLADLIVAGSEFCANTIRSARPDVRDKISIVNYCFDDQFFRAPAAIVPSAGPLKFLFIGQAGPRKGIHLLLKAMERIPRSLASLTVVGQLQVPKAVLGRVADRITFVPTVRREQVARFMAEADCFVLPSYFEGAAITVYEALAMGMGVIVSKNSGVEIGSAAGVLLSELSVEALTDAMFDVISNREKLAHWKESASKVSESYTFAKYARRVEQIAREVSEKD